jgi:plastocyanin
MIIRHRHPHRCGAICLALAALFAQAAFASPVTVTVTSASGVPVEDAVIVFDPLDTKPAATRSEASIDQINKRFVPRVNVVRTGTEITFPNSDRIRHQVYSFSKPKQFTLKLYAGSPKIPITFDQPGLVVLGCNIHDNMVGFVAVVDSPYFGKTTNAGTAAFILPPGRYRLRAWHPQALAAIPPQELTVAAAPLNIPLKIQVGSGTAAVTEWPE